MEGLGISPALFFWFLLQPGVGKTLMKREVQAFRSEAMPRLPPQEVSDNVALDRVRWLRERRPEYLNRLS